ncbi:MAG: SOS response-associated peptidase [Sulfurimonadaceae bacterium]|nr:SOS response-associated peptidase [Sulfurimonadaceae bacterium]
MCGRVGFYDDAGWSKAILAHYGHYNNLVGDLLPSYNIAPSQPMATLLNSGDYTYTHFGLIPHWAKETKFQPINARAETIASKPTFKSSFSTRRCLIPVNGFYEWYKAGNHKIPYWITPSSSDFFALAGIYDEWHDPASDETIISSAIITTSPTGVMEPIHDRMPVILNPDDWKLWLDPKVTEPEAVAPLLSPCRDDLMHAYEVSTYVNSPSNNDEKCIAQMSSFLF